MNEPERDRSKLIALAVFVCTCVYLWPLRDYVFFNADEGIILCDADRILRGQVPYRDFFSLYTPGSYFLLALAFKAFGQSLVVARTLLLLYCGVFSSLTYLLARRMSSRTASLFAAGVLVFGCLPHRFLVLHNWDTTLFAMVALYSATRFMERRSLFWATALGLSAALTCLTEQARGGGLLLGLALAGLALWPRWRDNPIRPTHVIVGCAGFLFPFIVTFAYFGSEHAIVSLLQAWLWPLRQYSGDNHVGYGFVTFDASLRFFTDSNGKVEPFAVLVGAPIFLVSALAVMVVIGTAYWLICFYRSDAESHDLRVLGGCTFLGIWLSTLATSRADFNHILYITPLFMYLLPSLLDIRHRWMRALYAARPLIAVVLLVSFAGFGLLTVLRAVGPTKRLQTRRGDIRVSSDDQVIPYVQAHLAEGEYMFVHPYQPLYSFLTATVPATRFDGMLRSTPEALSMVEQDLSMNAVPVVLLERTFMEKASLAWPAISLGALTNDPVGDYLLRHYHHCKVLNLNPPGPWIFDFMVRNDLPCPTTDRALAEVK